MASALPAALLNCAPRHSGACAVRVLWCPPAAAQPVASCGVVLLSTTRPQALASCICIKVEFSLPRCLFVVGVHMGICALDSTRIWGASLSTGCMY